MTPLELYQLTLQARKWHREEVEIYHDAYCAVNNGQMSDCDVRYTLIRDRLGVVHGTPYNIVLWAFERSHKKKFKKEELEEIKRAFESLRRELADYDRTRRRALNQQDIYSLAERREAQRKYESAMARGISRRGVEMKLFSYGLPDFWSYEDVEEYYNLLHSKQ